MCGVCVHLIKGDAIWENTRQITHPWKSDTLRQTKSVKPIGSILRYFLNFTKSNKIRFFFTFLQLETTFLGIFRRVGKSNLKCLITSRTNEMRFCFYKILYLVCERIRRKYLRCILLTQHLFPRYLYKNKKKQKKN